MVLCCWNLARFAPLSDEDTKGKPEGQQHQAKHACLQALPTATQALTAAVSKLLLTHQGRTEEPAVRWPSAVHDSPAYCAINNLNTS